MNDIHQLINTCIYNSAFKESSPEHQKKFVSIVEELYNLELEKLPINERNMVSALLNEYEAFKVQNRLINDLLEKTTYLLKMKEGL